MPRVFRGLCAAAGLLTYLLATQVAHGQLPISNADAFVNRKLAQDGSAEFLVVMKAQADLSAAAQEPDKVKKGEFVVSALRKIADDTQLPLLFRLSDMNLKVQRFWVVNMFLVRTGVAGAARIASQPEVARLCANPHVRLGSHGSLGTPVIPLLRAPEPTIEWGLLQIHAKDVWDKGIKGAGIVVGDLDSGVLWTHQALRAKYRGTRGEDASHDYNWHDAIHEGGSENCRANSTKPCDDTGHGTHTTGTMVGSTDTVAIGVAPGAKWIACRSMSQDTGSSATFSECFQWFLAPRKLLTNDGGKVAMAPHVINASWVCPPSRNPALPNGCEDPIVLKQLVDNVRAAGIVVVAAAGNKGLNCGSIDTQPATFDSVFTVGATLMDGSIWDDSSRGPATIGGVSLVKPNVSAPGVKVRSSMHWSNDAYADNQGTSMASPHVAGAVALLLSAYPRLVGQVDAIRMVLERTADAASKGRCGETTALDIPPNNTYGWGVINVLEAIRSLSADLGVAIEDPIRTGATLTYKVTVRNSGPAPADRASLRVTLPTGAAVNSATSSPGQCDPASTTVRCFFGTVLPNGRATVTIVVRPTAAGTLKISAEADATEPDLNSADDSATVETVIDNAGPG